MANPSFSPTQSELPVREIPGGYGFPFIGPIMDRFDYFYNQGHDGFFQARMEKYKSTVFRANMPPGPFISSNSKCVVLLDGKSFPVLFDLTKVDKKDLFTGTYIPSTKLTGGYRVLAYIDPSEPKHALLKNLMFFMLKSRREHVVPEFNGSYKELFKTLENEIASKGRVNFNNANDLATFNFLARSFFGVDPTTTKVGTDGPKLANKWLLFQIHPIFVLGFPKFLEDFLLHTFPLPPFLVKKDYQRLYNFFYKSAKTVLDEAEKMGIPRDEACHNLLFAVIFNAFGGIKVLFPLTLKWIGLAGVNLQIKLAEEIRAVVKSNDGVTSVAVMEQMPLLKSVVYETLRIDPPVPFQYARAKRDFVVESHNAAFNIKKGEVIFGYQTFATNDPKIFESPEKFVPHRFVGEGEKLLKHVMWSNAPETESPSTGNKQCAGKDFVLLVTRLFLVEFFLRYDTFKIEIGEATTGSTVTLTSFTKASF